MPASRKLVVGECRVWTDKDIVLESHAIPELNAGLHGDAVPDDHVVLDKDMVTDVAVGSDACSR
jgi:hypothetical protein